MDEARLLNRVDRERRARLEAERLAESKTLELYQRQHEVQLFERMSSAANAATTAEQAAASLLEIACLHLGWPVGHAYFLDPDGVLRSSGAWYLADADRFAAFRVLTEATTFTEGVGLPGLVLSTGRPQHQADFVASPGYPGAFPRALKAIDVGLRAALAVPVGTSGETLGVIEFLHTQTQEPDARQRDLLLHLAHQLGAVLARENAARQVLAAKASLEEQVRLRTAELEQATRTAERAVSTNKDFLATMTHELRTPMSGVLGMTSLLLDSTLDETQRDYACHILSATEALLSVVDDILDFSKVEAGRMQIDEAPFDPVALVDDVLALLGMRAADKRIDLASFVAPEVPELVRGDSGRVRQILVNLVGNALKFTETGHVLVRLTAHAAPGDAVDLRFDVEDTGIGIAPEKLGQLFQPFVQAEASTSRRFGGTGLGLSICRRLAEALGGTTGVESTPNHGSTFWFTVRTAPVAQAPSPALDLEGKRVLVMSRSAITERVVRELLESARCEVVQALTASQTVALARGQGMRFDAAIVDLHQREAKATAAGASFRELLGPECRIVALAQPWNRPKDEPSSFFDAVVMVPIRRRRFLEAMAALLGRGTQPAPLPLAPLTGSAGRLAGFQVLLAEDDLVNQKVACTFLDKMGCVTTLVDNGRDAVAAAARQRFDLVLMDCQLPEMDGYDAARSIRQLPHAGALPIVAMTASAEAGVRDRCLAAGMSDYLVKPVRLQLLSETLLRWAERAVA